MAITGGIARGAIVRPAVILYSAIPGLGTTNTTRVDGRGSQRLLFHIVSSLDQAITVQAFGNFTDSVTNLALIANLEPIPIGSVTTQVLTIGISDVYWHPYVGVQIIAAVAPASGLLTITFVGQD